MLNDNLQAETNALLREMRDWLRAGFHQQVGLLLASILTDDKKRRAYQMADGLVTVKEVCKCP
jgi:hypothetical protein